MVLECIHPDLIARATETARRLRHAGLRLVTAESCTAGLISAVLAQTEGAGEVFEGGFVFYTKDAKAEALGVDEDGLQAQGAVNTIVAAEMCSGASPPPRRTLPWPSPAS